MTLAYSTRYKLYQPVVLTDTFVVPFPIFSNNDLRVEVDGVETSLFSVTATYSGGRAEDASIVLDDAVTGVDVEIFGDKLPARETDYLPSSPDLAKNLQLDVDVLTAIIQEVVRDALAALTAATAAQAVVDSVADNAASAAASAASAAADAALAQSAQENLYDNYAGAWQNTTSYTRGQWVQDGGSSYLCIANHTSLSALNRPGLGSGWASYWALFAAKGNPGAGTGDVVAANAGSEYVSVAGAFRNNISAMLRAITKRSGLNLATDTTIDSTIYNSDGTNTNGPSGNADGDSFVSSKIDNSTYNYLWFGNARAWLGRRVADVNTWVELATKAYVDSKGMPAPNFESAEITLVSDGDFSVAHSLGAVPNLVIAVLVCKTANLGYAVGDELVLAGNSGTNTGITWAANGTNIVGSFGSQIPVNAIGATSGNITYANWKLVLRAWL